MEDVLTRRNDDIASRYSHINGWGHDADPKNNPTYPMKNWTGDDHKRLDYEREPQQPENIELLKSIERPQISRVYGQGPQPSGLSGMLRRFAYKYSESTYAHWFPLVAADRINVIEGYIDDFKHGIVPNPLAERGMTAEWKYNRQQVVRNLVVAAAVTGAIVYLFSQKKGEKKMLNTWADQS